MKINLVKLLWPIFFIAIFFKQLIWLGLVPLWHTPDEQAHFAQIQNTTLLGLDFSQTNKTKYLYSSDDIAQSEKLLGVFRKDQGRNDFTLNPTHNIEYTDSTIGKYEDQINNLPHQYSSDQQLHEATTYPFLYYFLGGFFYRLFFNSNIINRVFILRFYSLLIYLTNIYFIYLIAKKLFKKELAIFTLTFLCAFHPMFSFVGVSVSSDVLFNLIYTIFIYSALLFIEKKYKRASSYLILTVIAGFISKQQMFIVFPTAVFLILTNFSDLKKFIIAHKKNFYISTAISIPIFKLLFKLGELERVFGFWGYEQDSVSFLSYLKWSLEVTYRQTLPWYWGVFKWLSVTLPRWVNRIQMGILFFSSFGFLTYIFQLIKSKKFRQKDKKYLFLFYASVIYYLSLVTFDWIFRITKGFSFGLQGRYFFPTIISHMLLIFLGLKTLTKTIFKKRFSHFTFHTLLIVWWFCLHLSALYTVAKSYYNLSSVRVFLTQLSQYKPIIFKGNWWYLYIALGLLSLLILSLSIYKTHANKRKT
jgi:dolichyl-phosphate-mannose-protein mannosyltransferase